MAREVREIDRLIEAGLTLYGQGDLDGALRQWERALSIDPDNPQAKSYVEYVRTNYEALTTDVNGETISEPSPFGIADDEPEYQIEIQPGEIRPVTPEPPAPMHIDPADEGWLIDDETTRDRLPGGAPRIRAPRASQELTLEMEADEPPDTLGPPTTPQPVLELEPPGVSFEDATREYQPRRGSAESPPVAGTSDDFGPEGTPGFGHPSDFQTPPGFGSAATGIKQRDLGFVKPASATELGLPLPRKPAAASAAPPSGESEPAGPPPIELSLEADEPALDLTTEPSEGTTMQRKPFTPDELEEIDLISSLPSPRPAPVVPQIAIETPLSGSKQATRPAAIGPTTTTRDFPNETRLPAFATAPTRELEPQEAPPVVTQAPTQDFEVKTKERDRGGGHFDQPALTSAPTRDLGLRDLAPVTEPAREATSADVVDESDVMDARVAEILEEIDAGATPDEPKEDHTRRRISTLFERAAEWSTSGDPERAVMAVDLALLEDPNSALAQKLIHRNRETMMNVFQAYLGDLERTPQLARPLHELANAPISPRAAFLLSRIDGLLTIDEILDVCGMPRLEAYRYLCQLFLRGILR